MNFIKVGKSGQITLPKIYRSKYKTDVFTYEVKDDEFVIMPVKIMKLNDSKKEKKYTLRDLRKGMFHSKNKRVKNLSEQIDKIIYHESK